MIIHAGTINAPASRIIRIAQPFQLISVDTYPIHRVISGGDIERVTDRDAIIDRTTGAVAVTDYQLAVQYIGTPATPATYLSSDPAVATVDADGFVTHVAEGSVEITVSIGGQSAVVPLTMAETGGATVDVFVEYLPGTLGANASDEIDSRIAGKSPATALTIFTTQNHAAGTYTRNPACWAADVDLTAISPWNSTGGHRGGGILIAPDVLLCAAHYDYQFPIGGTVRFVAADGTPVNRTIAGRQRHPGYTGFPGYQHDITLCRLSSDVPESITPVKIWPADWAEHLPALSAERNIPVLVSDQEEKALVTDLRAIDSGFYAGKVGLAAPTEPQRLAFYEPKILHDSGNPVCAIVEDELVLLAVLTSGGAGSGTNLSAEIDTLNSMMLALGSAYQVEEYEVPPEVSRAPNYFSRVATASGTVHAEQAVWDLYSLPAVEDMVFGMSASAGLKLIGGKVDTAYSLDEDANDVTQSTDASRPAWSESAIGGKPALVFDGVDDYLLRSGTNIARLASGISILMVVTPHALATGNFQCLASIRRTSGAANDLRADFVLLNNTGALRMQARPHDTGSLTVVDRALTVNVPIVVTASIDYLTGAMVLRVNASAATTTLATTGLTPDVATILSLGSRTDGTLPVQASIGAAHIFSRVLTPAEITAWETALADYYGITLATP